jgi:L-ribulose-5-phosphate 4-epimerase
LQREKIRTDYEVETGEAIVRRFRSIDPGRFPAVLVSGHGPFCWGVSPQASAELAILLEEIARTAYYTITLNPSAGPISDELLDKHFLRKHGPDAYYGQ